MNLFISRGVFSPELSALLKYDVKFHSKLDAKEITHRQIKKDKSDLMAFFGPIVLARVRKK